jgi:hypothetical protein
MTRLLALILVLLGVMLLTEQPLQAGGIMVAPATAAIPPTILQERAVIAWDGKMESLLVEPSLDAKGESFGWILPLPKVPESVEKGSPAILNTLDLCCRGIIVKSSHETGRLVAEATGIDFPIIFFLGILLFFIGKMIWKNRELGWIDRGCILVFFLLAMFLPCLSRSSADRSPRFIAEEILVHPQRAVGDYDVTVLECKDIHALDSWLDTHGFAKFPKAGKPMVEEYIRNGWCFVACKLRMDGDGPRTPHPLLLKFPATTPVYPMKLTALANSPVYLKLFVIAPQRMEIPLLRTDYADSVAHLYLGEPIPHPPELQSWLNSKEHIVTAAGGRIMPTAMATDLVIGASTKQESVFLRQFYTPAALREKCLILAFYFLLAGASVILMASLFDWVEKYRRFALVAGGLLLAIAATAVSITVIRSPLVGDIRKASFEFFDNDHRETRYALDASFEQLKAEIRANPSLTKEEIYRCLWEEIGEEEISFLLTNPYTGMPIQEEASPGNFSVEMTPQGPIIRYYAFYHQREDLRCETWPLFDSSRENKSNPDLVAPLENVPAASGAK